MQFNSEGVFEKNSGKRFGTMATIIMAVLMGIVMGVAAVFVNHASFSLGTMLKKAP